LKEHLNRIEVAQNHLNNALSFEEVDEAIYELLAAELSLRRYIREVKRDDN
jgi:hypothetical protein